MISLDEKSPPPMFSTAILTAMPMANSRSNKKVVDVEARRETALDPHGKRRTPGSDFVNRRPRVQTSSPAP
jgi:hypothetical protein